MAIADQLAIFPWKIYNRLRLLLQGFRRFLAQDIRDSDANKYRIVFFPVEVTHLKQMIPVSDRLDEKEFIYITNRLAIYNQLRKKGIACRMTYKEKGSSSTDFDYLTLGKGFIPEKLKNEWAAFCKIQIDDRYFKLEKEISCAMEILNPQKVIVGYDITPEGRLCAHVCRRLGILSISIQHGSVVGEPLDTEHIVETYLVYGERAKAYLTSVNRNQTSFEVFGAPYLDSENHSVVAREIVLSELNLLPKHKTVLVALSGPGHCTTHKHFFQIVSSLVKLARDNRNINLIFKLHRKDSLENYTPIFNQLNFVCPIIEANDKRFSTDIFFWINQVDLLVTGGSAVALEAMLKGKPVVIIDYQNEYQDIDFIDMGCTFQVTDESQLSPTVSEVLSLSSTQELHSIQRNARSYINEYFHSEKEPASLRIANWLLQ